MQGIAKWNGTNWQSLGNGLAYSYTPIYIGRVNSIVIVNNNVYAGGFFVSSGSTIVNYVAKWNGTNWEALDTGLPSGVNSLATDSSNNLYAGGAFGLKVWNGNNWNTLGDNVNGNVNSIIISGTDIYIAGNFSSIGNINIQNIAKWNGSIWSNVGKGTTINIDAMTIYNNSIIAVGDSILQTYPAIDSISDNIDYIRSVQDSYNQLHVIYTDHINAKLKYKYFNGTSWSESLDISDNTINNFTLSINAENNVYASWTEQNNTIKYRIFNLQTYSLMPIKTFYNTNKIYHLISDQEFSSNLKLLWTEDNNTNYKIKSGILSN